MPQTGPLIDTKELRSVLGGFLTGVTVVTTHDADGRPRGLTANSFTSVSLEPPLILVCIGDHAASYGAFLGADRFAVNVLTADQRDTSALFASRRADKFDAVNWHTGKNGAPLLDDALLRLECDVYERIECADHILLIGRVRAFQSLGGTPLGFYRGNYIALEEEQGIGHATQGGGAAARGRMA